MSTSESSASPLPVPPPVGTPLTWRLALTALVLILAGLVYAGREKLDPRVRAGCGIVCFIATVAACSQNLRAVRLRTVLWGIALQIVFALFILETELGETIFKRIGGAVQRFLEFTNVGSAFVFGKLAEPAAVEQVFGRHGGFIFAFQALPTIIFVSSFFTVLYYFGILQFVVRVMAKAMMYMMGTSGAESLSSVANVFMGQTEAPLIVKPYVPRMTKSELLAMMVGGMATISGGVMAVYINMGADATAILATSVMAAPCGLYLSKLMWPETELPETHGSARIKSEKLHANVIDAAAGGASDGLHLALNVAAMIIAFLAFIALIDALLGGIKPALLGLGVAPESLARWPDDFSLTTIFSTIFYPVALLMGADVQDADKLADLLGIKLVTNEFIAYSKLTKGEYAGVISKHGLILAKPVSA